MIDALLENNRQWAEALRRKTPTFFSKLAEKQTPGCLWIGCADSRVPASQVVGLQPGELFVHRNIANLVLHTDLNCLSVIEYAVDVLRVDDVIVCGHYGCGGVAAAMRGTHVGVTDNWLHHIREMAHAHRDDLSAIADEKMRLNHLCELNVHEQVRHVCQTTTVQQAWRRDQAVAVHGCIYNLEDGTLTCIRPGITSPEMLEQP